MWRKYAVSAESLEDFLQRYYKTDRYTGRGEDYAESLRQSYRETLSKDGVCIISHHDSKTGEVVAYYQDDRQRDALLNQFDQATASKPIKQWQPLVITYDGRQRPAYVRPGQFAQGSCTYHLQILRRGRIAGTIGNLLEFFRVQKDGVIVEDGYKIIYDDEAQDWIEKHRNQQTL